MSLATMASHLEADMNHLINGGLYKLWEDNLLLELSPIPGMKHLHVAAGTGDVAFRILETIIKDKGDGGLNKETQVHVCDSNLSMLNVAKKRAQQRGLGELESLVWVEGDAEKLPFEDNSMDSYTIAFGMRNATNIQKVLAEAYRVLKTGGKFVCLELRHYNNPRSFKEVYDLYSMKDIPALGKMVAGDRDPFEYVVEGVLRLPLEEVFASMIKDAGFQDAGCLFLAGGATVQSMLKPIAAVLGHTGERGGSSGTGGNLPRRAIVKIDVRSREDEQPTSDKQAGVSQPVHPPPTLPKSINEQEEPASFLIMLVGDPQTGKSTFLTRDEDSRVIEDTPEYTCHRLVFTTNRGQIWIKCFEIHRRVEDNLHDLRAEPFDGAIIMFDTTQVATLQSMRRWHEGVSM